MTKMKLLYISDIASCAALKDAACIDPSFSNYASHKFNRLVVEGFAHIGHHVHALSSFHLAATGRFYMRNNEMENGVKYSYITSPNINALRYIWLILYSFIYVFFWGLSRRKEKALICDVLNISVCIGAVAACRLTGLRRVGIVTDIPGIDIGRNDSKELVMGKRKSFKVMMNNSFLHNFTHYVFLTEQMNAIVNKNNRPYIVMEGLVDSEFTIVSKNKKQPKKVVLYAGGLMERYGLKMLVEGFIKANVENSELWIYGSGPFVKQLEQYNIDYPSIIYKGVKPNEEVIAAELMATLLVNPRPTHEEFTKYSFPSKNMEYMVSGTPLLTTPLPGMPKEYYPYVYLFDKGETIDGYADVIKRILTLSSNELQEKGEAAQKWVLEEKNNKHQTARIVKLVQS